MATLVSSMRASLLREVNVPGFAQLPTITTAELDGYLADGFWEARLLGMLDGYTLTDGTEQATPLGSVIFLSADNSDLASQLQLLVVIVAGLKLIRLKALALAQSLAVKAGPVEYERTTSATVLRAILDSLERRLAFLQVNYSDMFSSVPFHYFDSEIQREYSLLHGLAELTVL